MKRLIIAVAAMAWMFSGASAEDLDSIMLRAEQGHADEQFMLGVKYLIGEGVHENHVEAAKWLQRAAEQGHVEAQFLIGVSILRSDDSPEGYRESAKWLRRAAKQGHAGAQYRLAAIYALGRGVPQDYVEAHMWANLAAAGGHSRYQEIEELRAEIASMMTSQQIAEAQRLAREWQPKKE